MEEILTLNKEIIEISVEDIIPNRFQPRLTFDAEALNELANSIREHGIIQPLVVRRVQDKFEIIAGERRYKAASLIGMKKVPCIVMDLNDNESAEVAVIENIQRKEMTPLEEAKSFKKLLDKGYLTQDELAKRMGKSQSSIANKLRLLNLDEVVQEAILNGKISERHARSLLKVENKQDQRNILNEIIEKRLTVKQTDDLIKEKMNVGVDIMNENSNQMNNNIFNNNPNQQNNNMFSNNQNNDYSNIFKEPVKQPVHEENNNYMQNNNYSTPEVNIPSNDYSNPQMNILNSIGNTNQNVNSTINEFNRNDINNSMYVNNDINSIINPSVLSTETSSVLNNNQNNSQEEKLNIFTPSSTNIDINEIKNNAQDILSKHEEPKDISNLMNTARPENKFFVDLDVPNNTMVEPLPFRVQNAVDSIDRRINEIRMQGTSINKQEKDLGNVYEIVIRIDK